MQMQAMYFLTALRELLVTCQLPELRSVEPVSSDDVVYEWHGWTCREIMSENTSEVYTARKSPVRYL